MRVNKAQVNLAQCWQTIAEFTLMGQSGSGGITICDTLPVSGE
jgi:hypothetical protein